MQWAKHAGLLENSPLDDQPEVLASLVGAGGDDPRPAATAETGPCVEKNLFYVRLLESLANIKVHWITLSQLSWGERMAVARWAQIEEYLSEKKRKGHIGRVVGARRKRIARERAGVVGKYMGVEELERRALEFEGRVRGEGKVAEMQAVRYWKLAERRRKEIAAVKKKLGQMEVVHEEDDGVGIEREGERPEVEMEVVRVGPNPRVLVCRYKVLAEERIVKLKVKSVEKFIRGMRIKMVEQEGVEWEYRGTLPRRKGVW